MNCDEYVDVKKKELSLWIICIFLSAVAKPSENGTILSAL